MSEEKKAKDEFGWRGERLNQLIENVEDYAIFITNLDGIIETWNVGAQRLFGYKAEEAIGQHTRMVFTPEDREKNIPEQEMRHARENGSAKDERWHLRKDGSRFFASGFQTAIYELGECKGYAKIARDLTERIRLEEKLKDLNKNLERKVEEQTAELRNEIAERKDAEASKIELLQKIVRTQEDERKRISRDLHDHLGQKLTALRLNLSSIRQKCVDDDLCSHIERVERLAEILDSEVDFLAWELRPASIDELGFEIALENFVSEFSRHFQIPAEFHSKGLGGRRLVAESEINLYRIAQEALNNISKHAKARNVSVLIEKPNDHVVLIIEDDGVGFDPKDKANRSKGLGLLGMGERAALIGGSVEIESAVGSGTTIYARVPAYFTDEDAI